jgi:hypothetical protein
MPVEADRVLSSTDAALENTEAPPTTTGVGVTTLQGDS